MECHTIVLLSTPSATLSLTAYKPTGKFGALDIEEDNQVRSFLEKPAGDGNWINAGFFVCEPEVFNYIPDGDDTCIFERTPLERIATAGKMFAHKHRGFWKCMDILRDNLELNEMWNSGKAPWKVWK
ncbi:glucose-1-phosphate cytidylyltransferase [Candidatus Symbiothrix dinenymphae]|nr:glucose-1-phosphate cytidylyltransferase [Candidatus Symbiothrix dinenymphae]